MMRDEISEEEIKEIKTRLEKTTPGPWTSISESRGETVGTDFIMTAGEDIYLMGATLVDQDFIAHARQDVPRLIAEIERLKASK